MITLEQAITNREFHEEPCIKETGPRGGITVKQHVWRKTGMVKTWKRRPGEFSVGVKYGLRSYGRITNSEAHLFHVPDECPLNTRTE